MLTYRADTFRHFEPTPLEAWERIQDYGVFDRLYPELTADLYYCSKAWDQIPRVDSFLTDYFCSEGNLYNTIVSRMLFQCALAKGSDVYGERLCMFGFEGTTAMELDNLKEMLGQAFLDSRYSVDFIYLASDPKYQSYVQTDSRNRRFLPITCRSSSLERYNPLPIIKEQIWLEAVQLYKHNLILNNTPRKAIGELPAFTLPINSRAVRTAVGNAQAGSVKYEVDTGAVITLMDSLDLEDGLNRDYLTWADMWHGLKLFGKHTRGDTREVKRIVSNRGGWYLPGPNVYITELKTKLRCFIRKSGRYGNRPGLV